MNQDELNNLLNVMQKKISELTTQNIMLEAKVIFLSNIINSAQQPQSQSEEFMSAEEIQETPKSRRSA